MKISIVFVNNKKSNPNDLITTSLDRMKNYIDKEFQSQYQIQELEHSITKENLMLNFSCRLISKEIENNSHVEEIQSLLTKKAHLKKIFHIDNTFDIKEIIIIPTKRLEAIKKINTDTTKIDPYFADYCARHLSYCKDMLKRDVQNITIEYEQKGNNDEHCTGKLEERYIKSSLNNTRASNLNNIYHCFATAILKNDALKNKLLSSGIRSVLMKNNETDITLEVEVSDEAYYSYSIKKSHSLLTPYSESSPLLTMGMYAVKINGEDPDPFEHTRLLSSSNYF